MTLTAVQKAEMDRGILAMDISTVERKIVLHLTTPLKLSAAESYLDTLAKIKPSLFEVHSRIAYQSPANIADHQTEYLKLDERITNAKADLTEIINNIKTSVPIPSSTPASTTPHIKLPDMQLPAFNGKYEDWLSFEDLFQATIGKNTSLTNAQKLQYLKASVQGDAANLIKSFIVTDQNYSEAWSLLKSRYNNEGEIIYSLCKKMLYQTHLKSESVTGLQQLLNTTMESVRSLKAMGQPVDKWDSLLVVTIVEKLDPDTRSEWAKTRTSTTPSTLQDITDFMEKYIRGLLAKGALFNKVSSNNSNNKSQDNKQRTFRATAAPSICVMCKGSHQLYQCPKLHEMDASQRITAVKKTSACLNCLRDGHSSKDCKSTHTCRKCSSRHHTLLHNDQQRFITSNPATNSSSQPQPQSTVRTNFVAVPGGQIQRIFKTAIVDIEDSVGVPRQCRVLYDDCSEANYITESCASALGLRRAKTNVIVEGVGEVKAAHCKYMVSARLCSRVSSQSVFVETLLVMNRITGYVPRLPCDYKDWKHLKNLPLADPEFNKPGEIDILIGTGVVSYIMDEGIQRGPPNQPVAFNSIFGWVLSGVDESDHVQTVRTHHTTCRLEELVQRFWEVEQLPSKQLYTTIEAEAERHFVETHTRKPDGRYVVRLPFNDKKSLIGDTRELAVNRLYQLEKRFKKHPEQHQQYILFMREYLSLGHMEPSHSNIQHKKVYIPHHFVRKDDSSTTKLRVVFDASMKSTTGISLNDTLLVGPTIQDELFTQLVRFRTFPIAMKADIAKMYRQFEIYDEDRNYQTILWRESPDEEIKEYRLTTVTYGTASAPFLATRCLHQLTLDEEKDYPKAALAIRRLMYIDDLLGGQTSQEDSLKLFSEIDQLCSKGCLDIRKWCSSNPMVMACIPAEKREEGFHEFNEDTSVKALGIRWKAQGDYFYFTVENKSNKKQMTKREVLSEIARTFDPLGWLSPTTVIAKILFQDLWKETNSWDSIVSDDILQRWNQYCSDLQQYIPRIQIPRIIMATAPVSVQLFGCADSSEKCMACCIYLRSVDPSGFAMVNLVTARTKIAPIKQVSIPRLELNSAVLLAETIEAVTKCFDFEYTIHAYTDSMITLCWLTATTRKWKSYVATRVATVLETVPARCWNHVRSSDNPADLPSRGLAPADLLKSNLWWHGPSWLITASQPPSGEETDNVKDEDIIKEERIKTATMLCFSEPTKPADLLFQSSSLVTTTTTLAWLFRFLKYRKNRTQCLIGPLTPNEKSYALTIVIKYVQRLVFDEDVKQLQTHKQVPPKSNLRQLYPFFDKDGVLRVGGRIKNANTEMDAKSPIILPHRHPITILVINYFHTRTLHGGFTLTLSMLRRKFWILRGRDIVRFIINKCVRCRKIRATQSTQLMGNLPMPRVTPSRPFLHCGVDFAGSFPVRMRSGRGPAGIDKIYMAVFVCFSTKAVHLEPVTSLSTEHFIACFRRFTARRGIPSHMYSDCGTNFVGADKELQKLLRQEINDYQQQTARLGTTWVFNPPSAPHQGGLWEAAVKSAKYHLKRVIGCTITTYEQFCTLLCNVEACLNSRPLCPLSSDPTDYDALTPGHFLIGEPLLAVPEGDLQCVKENRLNQWQRVQQMTQHIWKRWQHEYLITLQQRQK